MITVVDISYFYITWIISQQFSRRDLKPMAFLVVLHASLWKSYLKGLNFYGYKISRIWPYFAKSFTCEITLISLFTKSNITLVMLQVLQALLFPIKNRWICLSIIFFHPFDVDFLLISKLQYPCQSRVGICVCELRVRCYLQKQSFRGVLSKRCFENIKQIYRRTPMPKCDFNKVVS